MGPTKVWYLLGGGAATAEAGPMAGMPLAGTAAAATRAGMMRAGPRLELLAGDYYPKSAILSPI